MTFSAPSPPTHAGWRWRWCGLPLACSTARVCLSRVAARAWDLARHAVATWRASEANVCDCLQPRTPYARLSFLETSTAHASSLAPPRRARPSRAAEPSGNVASAALSPWQSQADVELPCAPSDQRRGMPCRIQRTSSSRMSACVDSDSSCKHDARALQLHGLLTSCRNKGTACP